MKTAITEQDDISIIAAEGDIDSKTASQFEAGAKEAAAKHSKIAIDLTAVEYMSSAGLRVLLMVYRNIKAENGKVVLVGVSEEIQDVMSTTGFISFFTIVATVEEALTILKKA